MNTASNAYQDQAVEIDGGTNTPIAQDVSAALTNVLDNTPPEISVPSIGSSAMLTELSISQWTGRKKDRKASKEVTADNNAASGVASVNKKLMGDWETLEALHKMTGNIRNMHYSMTMPWSDTGLRLLPTAQYFKYNKEMTAMQSKWEDLARLCMREYEWEISNAQTKLGDFFHRDEYPSVSALTNKFSFRLSYIPLADDFRTDVGAEGNEQIKAHYQEYYSRQLTNAIGDIWTRVHKVLVSMSERLDYASNETKKVFRDTLVDNVIDMIDLMNVCNITNDAQMSEIAKQLDNALRGVTPDALRDDDYLRAETKRKVDLAIAQLPSLSIDMTL